MQLAYWQNSSKASMERLYINEIDAFDDKRKIWIEPVGKSDTWRLNNKEAYSDNELTTIQNLLVKHLEQIGVGKKDRVLFSAIKLIVKETGTPNWKLRASGASNSKQTNKIDSIPKLSSIKVPDPVDIRIDHREPAELIDMLSSIGNVNVERCALELGDIELNGEILIERKCCTSSNSGTDFENSIINDDKRLHIQSERMKFEDKIPIILLEGDVYNNSQRMLIQSVDGAISFLCAIQRLSVIPTYNLEHTAYLILKLATHHRSGLGYELGLRSKKPKALLDQKSFVLEGLPGVNAELSRRILKRFGSIHKFMLADKSEMLSVKGLGEKTTDKIIAVIHGL